MASNKGLLSSIDRNKKEITVHIRNNVGTLSPRFYMSPDAFRAALDREAEREGQAMKRHRRFTRKHRKAVYRIAGVGSPLAV
jgi:hypothetical protein